MVSYTHDENVRDAAAMAQMYASLDRLPIAAHRPRPRRGARRRRRPRRRLRHRGRRGAGDVRVHRGEARDPAGDHLAVRAGEDWACRRRGSCSSPGCASTRGGPRRSDWSTPSSPEAELDACVGRYVAEVLTAAPERHCHRQGAAAEGVRRVRSRTRSGITADTIAARRVSAEGQEGMKAFLEKRKPSWMPVVRRTTETRPTRELLIAELIGESALCAS